MPFGVETTRMNLRFFKLQSLQTRVTVITLSIFLLGLWSLAWYASRMLREDMHRLLGVQQFSAASLWPRRSTRRSATG